MDLGLQGRVVFITGGSQGIGRAAAILFARQGARVALTFRERREAADGVVGEIERNGGKAMAVALDLSSSVSIQTAVSDVVSQWSGIDVLVNNAVEWGRRLPWDAPTFEDLPLTEWQEMLRANIDGAYTVLQRVVPLMRVRGWGRIVNVSSIAAADGAPGAGPYATAKAALHGLTSCLARELGPAGILVNVVMPGPTMTERALTVIPADQRESLARMTPVGRLLVPDDVAPLIVFLCSAFNTAVTGESIRASGGLRI